MPSKWLHIPLSRPASSSPTILSVYAKTRLFTTAWPEERFKSFICEMQCSNSNKLLSGWWLIWVYPVPQFYHEHALRGGDPADHCEALPWPETCDHWPLTTWWCHRADTDMRHGHSGIMTPHQIPTAPHCCCWSMHLSCSSVLSISVLSTPTLTDLD